MSRISTISQFVPGEMAFFREIIQGYAGAWTININDKDGIPINLAGQTLQAQAQYYMVDTTPSGPVPGSFTPIEDIANRDLSITIDSDQTNNTGKSVLQIPGNLYDGEIPIDATRIPCVIIVIDYGFGVNVRPFRGGILIRRGRES